MEIILNGEMLEKTDLFLITIGEVQKVLIKDVTTTKSVKLIFQRKLVSGWIRKNLIKDVSIVDIKNMPSLWYIIILIHPQKKETLVLCTKTLLAVLKR